MARPLSKLYMRMLPDKLADRRPDPLSPHRRRFTAAYRRKRAVVKKIWAGAGLIVLMHPTVATLIIVGLFTTFLSFTVLDETA